MTDRDSKQDDECDLVRYDKQGDQDQQEPNAPCLVRVDFDKTGYDADNHNGKSGNQGGEGACVNLPPEGFLTMPAAENSPTTTSLLVHDVCKVIARRM